MIELHEIEELFKSVNRHAIKAFLRNAAILKDPAATPEMKELAAANVKAISMNQPVLKPKTGKSKQKKTKATAAAEQATQLAQQPVPQTPAAAVPPAGASVVQPSPKMEFHEEFAQHHGIDPAKFKATWHAMTPEQKQITQQWHAEQVAAPKVAKSLDALYNLFSELKKRL